MSGNESAALRAGFLGVVLPMFHLLPYMDAADNVALGYRGGGGRGKAIESLAAIGLAGRERQLPDRMSAGERRRLIVARALLHEPGLILADEPTSNLDEANAAEIAQMLKARALNGAGVLLITHESSQRFEADRVFSMESGRLKQVPTCTAF
jgi:ABC-type lipoprotein export system ATPase subunit